MFLGGEDEEQDFVAPGGSTKLGSLFSLDKSSNVGGNSSLTYTAPKQPKKKESGPESGSGPAVLVASVVHAYKYVDGRYALQGKLGCALLGNAANKDYKILLYISKEKQVTNATITASTTFTPQANNYASFYDDARISWSIMFDSEENAVKFTKQICLAKAKSSNLDSVISQDISVGEGRSLESGDAAEVRYTGWLYTNHTYGQMFDSNANSDKLFRLKLGKGKVIKGWDMGLIGMKKGGKRMLIVPPNLGYGAQGMGDKIPANSTLIFETELVRAKFQKGDQSPGPSPAPVQPHLPSVTTGEEEPPDLDQTVKGRTKSITEHMAHPGDSGKAKLISRMAKMGKPMLPMPGGGPAPTGTASDDEDAEVEEQFQSPGEDDGSVVQKPQPQIPVRVQPTPPYQQPHMFTQQQPPAVSPHTPLHFQQYNPAQGGNQMALYQNQNYLQQQQQQQQQQQAAMQQALQPHGFQPTSYQMAPSGMMNTVPYSGPSSTPPSNQSLDVFGPVLLTETRQQNTEVRMAISKIADKVDKVYDKMNDIQSIGGPSVSHGVTAPNMEVSILIQNVTRIATENEQLKKDVFEKSAKIESQNDKIAELLHKNQRFVEQSNTLLEERNEGYKHSAHQSQAKVLELEQQKVQLATDLSASTAQLSTIQLELANSRKKEAELIQKIQSTTDTSSHSAEERERLRLQHSEDERKITELNSALREEKQHRKTLESAHNQLQEEFADIKTSKENMERGLADRKRKVAAERKKMEDEMEEMKTNLEQEIQTLRDKLRKQKTSTDVASSDKLSRIEAELEEEWKQKSDKMLSAANEKHTRALELVKEETDELKAKLKEAEVRIQSLKAAGNTSDEKINELEDEIEELEAYKDKYDNLRNQASAMKEKYEDRINDLEEENDRLTEKMEELEEKLSDAASGGGPPSGDLVNEVKKIMNNVYRGLRDDFETDESYKGSEVLSSILGTIKTTTLELVKKQEEKKEENAKDDDSEEDDEDEIDGEKEKAESEQTRTEQKPVVEETMTSDDVIVVESVAKTTAAPPTEKNPVTPAKFMPKKDHPTGDKGNRIYSEKLDKLNKPDKHAPVPITPVGFKEEHGYITGDKGNRIYSEKLDQLHSSAQPVTETIGKVESSQVHGSPPKSKNNDQSKPAIVEESFGKSEAMTLEAGSSNRKPVKPAKVTPTKDHPTGDKGNRIYSENLDKLNKPDKHAPVPITPVGFKEEHGYITGDKGNRIYSEKLDQSSPSSAQPVTETIGKTETSHVHASPPKSKNNETKPAIVEESFSKSDSSTLEAGSSNRKPVKPPKVTPQKDHPTGDKGNRIYSEKLDKFKKPDKHAPVPITPVGFKEEHGHITGDKGNRIYSEKLDQSSPSSAQPVTETVGKVETSHVLASPPKSKNNDTKPAIVEESFGKSESLTLEAGSSNRKPVKPAEVTPQKDHPTGDKGNRIYSEKLDKLKKPDKHAPVPITPVGFKEEHGHITGDKGNRIYSEKLDHLHSSAPVTETIGKVETSQVHASPPNSKNNDTTKSAIVQESFGKSESTTLEVGSSNRKPVPVVPAGITEEHGHKTGDKGNRIYSEKLDQSSPSSAGGVVEETVGKVETLSVHSVPPPSATTTDTLPAPVVEESFGKTESSVVEAGPPSSNQKPVKPAKVIPTKDHPTGDKGNRIYSEKLDQLNKPDKHAPVAVSKIDKKSDHIVGDKGNRYYTEELDNLKPVVAESFAKTESVVAHAAPPTNTKPEIKPKKTHEVQAPKPKPVTPHLTSGTAHITGDKGNRLYSEKLDKSKPTDPLRKPVDEKDAKKESDHIVGDKGNPYHTAALDNTDKQKSAKENKDDKSSKESNPSSSNQLSSNTDKSKALSQNSNDKSTNQVSNSTETKPRSSTNEEKKKDSSNEIMDKKSEESRKTRTSSSTSVENVPTLANREPPPLFDDDEDSPLFGTDTTVRDTFGTDFKEDKTKKDKKEVKKSDKTTNKLPNKNDLADDDDKQPPPPLFGDDDDEDDLNWLS
ncbi:FK506-binding protein 15 isoform X2 [Patella vulgata]|uniref:FK506-binding protein 15 isoform X2 n=1 Tax=Patella vulgata TaxID=6465 RepID=UPI0021801FD8|nr:FK506-binding protein 15 isoform X2 [Patella vulgata]